MSEVYLNEQTTFTIATRAGSPNGLTDIELTIVDVDLDAEVAGSPFTALELTSKPGTYFVTHSFNATGSYVLYLSSASQGVTDQQMGQYDVREKSNEDLSTEIDAVPDVLQIWNASTKAITENLDKTGYSLTTAERTAIASAVEAALISEDDGLSILTAIVTNIENADIASPVLVQDIKAALEDPGSVMSQALSTAQSALSYAISNSSALTALSQQISDGGATFKLLH